MFTIADPVKVHKCIMTYDLEWPLGVISRSRMWKSPLSSWWCEISLGLLWNTSWKSIADFQNPQKMWPWMTLKRSFQGHKIENGPHRLVGCSPYAHGAYLDRNVYNRTVNKSASWPLSLIDLYGSLQGHAQIWHLMTFTGLFQGHKS